MKGPLENEFNERDRRETPAVDALTFPATPVDRCGLEISLD